MRRILPVRSHFPRRHDRLVIDDRFGCVPRPFNGALIAIAHLVAAAPLGDIHALVGSFNQLSPVLAVVGLDFCQPDARRYRLPVRAPPKAPLAQAGQGNTRLLVVGIGQDQDELLPPQRTSMSPRRRCLAMVDAAAFNTLSPASWPKLSLMLLK